MNGDYGCVRSGLQRLGVDLSRVLFPRDDLTISGRDFSAPMDAARVTVSRDYYSEGASGFVFSGLTILNLAEGYLELQPRAGRTTRLGALRIECRAPQSIAAGAGQGADSAIDVAALKWMIDRQEKSIKQHGRPMARDALVQECKKEKGYPTTKGRVLFKRLREHLRNPPRT